MFDPRISLGSVLGIITIVGGFAFSWANLSGEINSINTRLDAIDKRVAGVEKDHDDLKTLEGEVEALLNGKDVIVPRTRTR